MVLRYRQMRPSDVRHCVDVLAAHPVLGSRYAEILPDLPKIFLSLMGCEAFYVTVFEEFDGRSYRILGGGTAAFVQDAFMRELKTPPFFWGTPEIIRRIKRNQSPILSDKELREANSGKGLSLHVWHTGLVPADMERPDVMHTVVSAFIDVYRGYRIKELVQQAETWEQFCGMRAAGGHFIRPCDGRYAEYFEPIEANVAETPFMVGVTAELARGIAGGASWVSELFAYKPPQFGLARSEQRLLVAALRGGTDEELSDELCLSLSAVKKTWRAVYDRVAACSPNLIHANSATLERGKEKKQRLIGYLREHPEELRPFSRKLVRQNAGLR